jgi:ubiquinone/menaquinone biosynthesis C-methylase UbiE
VVGVDLSKPLLDYARGSIDGESVESRLRFEIGNVEKMPFEDDSFDAAFNVSMVHWVNDPVSMLNEIERILKPGALIFVRDLRYSWLRVFEGEIGNAFTLAQARNIIGDSKLREGSFFSSLLWWNFEL